jgi:hypothetical protein
MRTENVVPSTVHSKAANVQKMGMPATQAKVAVQEIARERTTKTLTVFVKGILRKLLKVGRPNPL